MCVCVCFCMYETNVEHDSRETSNFLLQKQIVWKFLITHFPHIYRANILLLRQLNFTMKALICRHTKSNVVQAKM